jgi:hypothetical protein
MISMGSSKRGLSDVMMVDDLIAAKNYTQFNAVSACKFAGLGRGKKGEFDEEIAEQMYDALSEHFDVIELELSEYDDLSWAYINCLQTQDFIIIPGIGNTITDAEALKQYKELFPEYKGHIYQVQMREFIEEHGGALNCLTWTIRENYQKNLCKGAQIPLAGLEDNKDCPHYQ